MSKQPIEFDGDPWALTMDVDRTFSITARMQALALELPDPGDEQIICDAIEAVHKRCRSSRTIGLRVMDSIRQGNVKVGEIAVALNMSRPRVVASLKWLMLADLVSPKRSPTGPNGGRPGHFFALTKNGVMAVFDARRGFPGIFT